jgi:hypothetical protein
MEEIDLKYNRETKHAVEPRAAELMTHDSVATIDFKSAKFSKLKF